MEIAGLAAAQSKLTKSRLHEVRRRKTMAGSRLRSPGEPCSRGLKPARPDPKQPEEGIHVRQELSTALKLRNKQGFSDVGSKERRTLPGCRGFAESHRPKTFAG